MLSGIKVQAAIARNDRPNTQRSTPGLSTWVIQAPRAPASPWFTRVASKIPNTMGTGLRKRAASTNASNWVLSPISANATTPVETHNDSFMPDFRARPCMKLLDVRCYFRAQLAIAESNFLL
ncbi:MAG: hypothetical protein RL163_500 [Pseudomonadota bacterium]